MRLASRSEEDRNPGALARAHGEPALDGHVAVVYRGAKCQLGRSRIGRFGAIGLGAVMTREGLVAAGNYAQEGD